MPSQGHEQHCGKLIIAASMHNMTSSPTHAEMKLHVHSEESTVNAGSTQQVLMPSVTEGEKNREGEELVLPEGSRPLVGGTIITHVHG